MLNARQFYKIRLVIDQMHGEFLPCSGPMCPMSYVTDVLQKYVGDGLTNYEFEQFKTSVERMEGFQYGKAWYVQKHNTVCLVGTYTKWEPDEEIAYIKDMTDRRDVLQKELNRIAEENKRRQMVRDQPPVFGPVSLPWRLWMFVKFVFTGRV